MKNYLYKFTNSHDKRRGCVDLSLLQHWSSFDERSVLLYFSGDSIIVDQTPELMELIEEVFRDKEKQTTSPDVSKDQAAAPLYPVFTTSFDYPLLVENHLGERHKVPLNQFYSTGVAPDWAAAKSQAEKYGASSLGTVGYFRTPDGVLACTSRFQYYLDKEKNESI